PCRAHRIVSEFCGLVSGIPRLHDLVARLPVWGVVVEAKPFPFYDFALKRHGPLLILCKKVVAAERGFDTREHLSRLTLLVKNVPNLAKMSFVDPNWNVLSGLRYRG